MIARRTQPNTRNETRRAKEFPRCYGSPERVAWVQRQPCIICGARPSVNAHVEGGGMGRKANYDKIIPACDPHHREMDDQGRKSFMLKYGIDLQLAAQQTEARWQRHQIAAVSFDESELSTSNTLP